MIDIQNENVIPKILGMTFFYWLSDAKAKSQISS